jgi:hypothetical protein
MRRGSRVPYRSCHDVAEALAVLAEIAPPTVIVDIEPLVAAWNTDRRTLDAGMAAFLDAFARDAAGAGVRHIVFATNAIRRPSAPPTVPTVPTVPTPGVRYVAHAGKPLRIEPYRDLPRPGVVIGDQIATDGMLAWRLSLTFVHYIPLDLDFAPIGTRFMRALGWPLRHLLFRSNGA